MAVSARVLVLVLVLVCSAIAAIAGIGPSSDMSMIRDFLFLLNGPLGDSVYKFKCPCRFVNVCLSPSLCICNGVEWRLLVE